MGTQTSKTMVWYVAKDSEAGKGAGLNYAVSYAQGDRPEMEDTHIMQHDVPHQGAGPLSFFAVFDGHGGDFVSLHCASSMLNLCTSELQKGRPATIETLTENLRDGCFKMDELLNMSRQRALNCGSTGIMGFFNGVNYVVANVGDSRSVLVRRTNQSHRVIPLSFDHKPNGQIEAARIGNAGGFVETSIANFGGRKVSCSRVNGRLAVARAFGDFDLKQNSRLPAANQAVSCEPDVLVEEGINRDILILCCDGIWDVMSNEDVGEFVVDAMDALDGDVKAVSEVLVERAYALGSTDNMTAMIIDVGLQGVQ